MPCGRTSIDAQRAMLAVAVGALALTLTVLLGTGASAMPTITVNDAGDPLANGQALVDAVAQANDMAPTAENPVDIVLSAGLFDVDATTLVLADNVNIVGAGPDATTLCNCDGVAEERREAFRGNWFETTGTNRIADMTLRKGREYVFAPTGGDVVVENIKIIHDFVSSGCFSPRVASIDGSRFEVRSLTLEFGSPFCDDTDGGRVEATGTTDITVVDSLLSDIQMETGALTVIDSTIGDRDFSSDEAIVATGVADITVQSSSIGAGSAYFDATTIRMPAGGTLDIADSTVTSGAFGDFNAAIVATDTTITIFDSEFLSGISLTGGVVHVLNTNFESVYTDNIEAFDLNDASGSMTGGTITFRGIEIEDTRQVITGNGTMVLDGVMTTRSRVSDQTICIDTFNIDDPADPPFVPPDCQVGSPQSAYPDDPHAVPGIVEAEDYDQSEIANHSFADSDADNFKGAYRSDDVDIWETNGEDGYTVGRTRNGEWLEYTIDATTADTYDIGVRLATGFADPGSIRVSVDGAPVGTITDVPIIGWWNWSTVSAGTVDLTEGRHTVRLDILGNGEINLDRLELTATVGPDPECGPLSQEGEAGTIVGAMEASATAVASVPGTRPKYGADGFDGNDYVEFCVTTADAGVYELDAIVRAPDTASDSFFITVNDNAPITWHIAPNSPDFEDRTVKVGSSPVRFNLVEGDNIVRLYHREDGTELDSFTLRSVGQPVGLTCDGTERSAADGEPMGAMFVGADRAGSNIDTRPKYGADGFDGSDYVEYCVTVAEAGSYSISVSALSPDTAQNSFFITANDGDPVTWHIPVADGPATNVVRTATENPALFDLDAGENIVRFYHRETGTELLSFAVNQAA